MRQATLGLLALGLAAAAPAAAEAAGVTVSYNIDVGPLTVSVVKFSVDVAGDEARARARIKTAGMSRVFSEFGATAEAETRLGDAPPEPLSYDPPMKNSERKTKLDAALAGGVIDPITAVLRMGMLGDSPCPSTHEVFDGREVFELALTDKGIGKADGDAAWNGKVQRCSVRWTPIAGRSKDKGVPGDSYDVSFAPVADLENGRKLWLPVEMSGSIKGLGFKGYLTKVDEKADGVAD